MTAQFWTLLTEVDTVQVFFDLSQAEQAACDFVQSCDDTRTVTVENWRAELDDLNKEMEDAAEAPYLCRLKDHPLPDLTALAVLDDGELRRVEVSSPFLSSLSVASVETKFCEADYHPDDILAVQTPQGPIKIVGHIQKAQTAQWNIPALFDQLAKTAPAANPIGTTG